MIRILLLSILFFESVAAQGALDEGHEHPWSQPQLENATSYEIEVGDGVLKVHSFSAPIDVGENRLRNLTNVDRSTPLTLQNWGDFSGYEYDYAERGSFFRQWWLVNQRTMMFIVYESRVELDDAVSDEIDRIVNSMTVNES